MKVLWLRESPFSIERTAVSFVYKAFYFIHPFHSIPFANSCCQPGVAMLKCVGRFTRSVTRLGR